MREILRVENIEVYATAIGTIMAVIGITWTMCGNTEKKINTVFRRFDDYKHHLEETHVSKEVCGILHKQICEDIVEIKADIKKLLSWTNGRNNGSS
jgi:hypothetical protein